MPKFKKTAKKKIYEKYGKSGFKILKFQKSKNIKIKRKKKEKNVYKIFNVSIKSQVHSLDIERVTNLQK